MKLLTNKKEEDIELALLRMCNIAAETNDDNTYIELVESIYDIAGTLNYDIFKLARYIDYNINKKKSRNHSSNRFEAEL